MAWAEIGCIERRRREEEAIPSNSFSAAAAEGQKCGAHSITQRKEEALEKS